MNHLLRPRIWTSFRASSGVGPCDVPFRYASEPIPRYRGTVARWHAHLRGLATAIHEISGLDPEQEFISVFKGKDRAEKRSEGQIMEWVKQGDREKAEWEQ